MKTCTKCGRELPLEAFNLAKRGKDGHKSDCRDCCRAYALAHAAEISARNRAWRAANPDKVQAQAEKKRTYWAAHPEELKAKHKAYYEANHEELLARKRAEHARHRDARNAASRAYHTAHRDEQLMKRRVREAQPETKEKRRAYRQAHADELKAKHNAYVAANRDKSRAWHRADYARHAEKNRARQRSYWKTQPEEMRTRGRIYSEQRRGRELNQTMSIYGPGRCSYCARQGSDLLDPEGQPWHIDHVIPVGLGGPDIPENRVVSCLKCNLAKHDAPLGEWFARLRMMVAEPRP